MKSKQCIEELIKDWRKDGLISKEEQDRIRKCAERLEKD
jgi:hypothetical protein